MLPLIIGALGMIAYGVSEENKKPKAVKKMAQGGRLSVSKKYDSVKEYLKDAKKGDLVLVGRDEKDLEWIGDSHLDRFVGITNGEATFKRFGRKGLISQPENYSVIVVSRKNGNTNSGEWSLKPRKMANGGNLYAEQITKVANTIFFANEKNGKIKISTKASQNLNGLKYLIADLNSEHIASMIFEANEKNGKIKTEMGEKTYGQLLALISHAKSNKLDSFKMAKGGGLSTEEQNRFNELNEKINAYLKGIGQVSSKEMVEHAKLKHKRNLEKNPLYKEQIDWESKVERDSESKMAKGGEIDESSAQTLLSQLKKEKKLKRYLDTRGTGVKYFETIIPNKSEKGYFKRYESTTQGNIGTLQNDYLDESDLLKYFEKTSPKNKMAKGGGISVREERKIKADNKFSALKEGKRKSEKYAYVDIRGGSTYRRRNANQYGKTKGGNIYYEYHENRVDSKRFLQKGGRLLNNNSMDGFYVFSNKENKKISDIYAEENDAKKEMYRLFETIGDYSLSVKKFKEPEKKYIVWVSKDGNKRQLYGTYKSMRGANLVMNKLWKTGEYKEMGNKPLSMYEKEGFFGKGGQVKKRP
jgi:hypothetical protein